MSVNVRVKRTDLIKRLEKSKAETIAANTAANAAMPKQVKAWQTKSLAVLAKMAREVKAGREPKHQYLPSKPEPSNSSRSADGIERMIRVLRLSNDEFLTLNDKSDYYRYI